MAAWWAAGRERDTELPATAAEVGPAARHVRPGKVGHGGHGRSPLPAGRPARRGPSCPPRGGRAAKRARGRADPGPALARPDGHARPARQARRPDRPASRPSPPHHLPLREPQPGARRSCGRVTPARAGRNRCRLPAAAPVLRVHPTRFCYEGDAEPSAPGGMAAIYRDLVANDDRTAQVADDVAEALSRGRHCLVLTQWTAHLDRSPPPSRTGPATRSCCAAGWAPRPAPPPSARPVHRAHPAPLSRQDHRQGPRLPRHRHRRARLIPGQARPRLHQPRLPQPPQPPPHPQRQARSCREGLTAEKPRASRGTPHRQSCRHASHTCRGTADGL